MTKAMGRTIDRALMLAARVCRNEDAGGKVRIPGRRVDAKNAGMLRAG